MIKPEHFDLLGLITFAYLLILGIMGITKYSTIPFWIWLTLIIIGIFGLIIDSYNVIKFIIMKDRKVRK